MGAMKFAALITCYISNTHTLQCLIEMCAGNFTNQYVALDGQVLDSINRILGTVCTEKSTKKSTEKSVRVLSLYNSRLRNFNLIFLLCKIKVHLLCRS